MAERKLNPIVRYLRRLARSEGVGADDDELLDRYVSLCDEAAFELLLWRHGALVYNVCRRILHCEQDAEDAFQAVFLVFARKAHSIRRRASISSWLYKVAYRVALAARDRARKRATRETARVDDVAIAPTSDPLSGELRSILDEEVNRLPQKMRQAFVLCYLEGKTNEEAARVLDCRPGTIFSRLARGREILRKRLLRRGVAPAVAGAAALGEVNAAVPATTLMTATAHTALLYATSSCGGGISTQVAALTEGVLRTMFMAKLKMTALMVVLVAALFAAGGVATHHALSATPREEEPDRQPPTIAQAPEDQKEKKPLAPVERIKSNEVGSLASASGHIRPVGRQQVYSAVSGNIYASTQVVEIGDRVKRGQILARIVSPVLEAELKQARAAYELERMQVTMAESQIATAQAEVEAAMARKETYAPRVQASEAYLKIRKAQRERYAELAREKAIDARLVDEQQDKFEAAQEAVIANKAALRGADAEIEVQKSKVQSAKAAMLIAKAKLDIAGLAVEKAKALLEMTQLRANFDGIVTQRNFDEGEYVSANETGSRRPLLTVVRTDSVRVVVNVLETDISAIKPGLKVEVWSLGEIAPGSRKLAEARVSRIGFAVDEVTGTVPVEIDVPNPKGELRPGASVHIHFSKNVQKN